MDSVIHWIVSVVQRFGGEPQLMSDGNRCPMENDVLAALGGHQIHWTSIACSPTNRCITVLSHKNCLEDKLISKNNYHLFTETEGNSVFCGAETVDVSRPSRVHKTHCFPEVSGNKCFIIYQ